MDAFLRQIFPGSGQNQFPVSTDRETVIGRADTCDISLDPTQYQGVSGKHLEIRPLPYWQICDLGSTNGTFVNGQRLQGCQSLQSGDRIKLGNNGPEFIFEYQSGDRLNPTQNFSTTPDTQIDNSPATQFDNAPAPVPVQSSTPSSQPMGAWKIVLGIAVVAAFLYFITRRESPTPQPQAATPQQTSRAEAPQQTPSAQAPQEQPQTQPTTTTTSEFKIRFDPKFTQIFSIGSEPQIAPLPSGEFAGRLIFLIDVVPKSSLSTRDALFAAYFYNSQDTEVAKAVQLIYLDSSGEAKQLSSGQRYKAFFMLPSDQSLLKRIIITPAKGNEGVSNALKGLDTSQLKLDNNLRLQN